MTRRLSILLVIVLLATTLGYGQSKSVTAGGGECLWWDSKGKALFVKRDCEFSAVDNGFAVEGLLGESYLIAQPLLVDVQQTRSMFALWFGMAGINGLKLARFAGAAGGVYRSPELADAIVEDREDLKVLRTPRIEMVFARAGDGQWRVVSVRHTDNDAWLLIDYSADGLIREFRDKENRTTAEPVYKNGRVVSVVQTWHDERGNKHLQMTVVR